MTAASRLLLAIAVCLAAWSATASAQAPRATGLENLAAQSTAQLMADIDRKHLAAFYALAKRLFDEGDQDEAVF